jgi:hypothetical protein
MAAIEMGLEISRIEGLMGCQVALQPITFNNFPPDLRGTSDDTLVLITVLYICISVETVKLNFHLDMELRLNYN